MTLGVENIDHSRKNHHQGCFGTSLKIQHNWPFLVLCKTLSIDSRRDECDQYDPGRLMTVDDSQRVSGPLRAVDGAGSLKCHLAENYPDPVIENAKKWIPDQKIMTTCSVRVRAFSKIAEMGNFSIQKFHRPPQSPFGRFGNFFNSFDIFREFSSHQIWVYLTSTFCPKFR